MIFYSKKQRRFVFMSIKILSNSGIYADTIKEVIFSYFDIFSKNDYAEIITDVSNEKLCAESFNLYFIDLNNCSKKEIQLSIAKKIRQDDFQSMITLLSKDTTYSLKDQKENISVFDYVTDSANSSQFDTAVYRSLEQYFHSKNCLISVEETHFMISKKHKLFKLPFNELYYFSTIFSHKIEVVTVTNRVNFFGTLKS